MYLDTTPLVGLPSPQGRSQVVVTSDHNLVVVYSVVGDSSGSFADELALDLEQTTFASSMQVHQYFQEVGAVAQAKDIEVQFALAYSNGTQILFETYQGLVLLKRGSKVGVVLDTQEKMGIKEGRAQVEDELVLLTQVGRVFYQEIILKFQQGFDLDTTLSSVVSGLHNSGSASFAAIGFTRVGHAPALSESPTPDQQPEISTPEPEPFPQETQLSQAETPPTAPEEREEGAANPTDLPSPTNGASTQKASGPSFLQQLLPFVGQLAKKLGRGGGAVSSLLFRGAQRLALSIRQVLSRRDVYLGQAKKKEVAKWLVLIAIVVIIIAGAGGYWWQRRRQQQQGALQAIAPLQQQLQAAQSLANDDPILARRAVEDLLLQYRALEAQFAHQPLALALISTQTNQTEQILQDLLGQTPVSSLPIFTDLRNSVPGSIVTRATVSGNTAYFLDRDKQLIFQIDLSSGAVSTIPVDTVEAARDLVAAENTVFVLGKEVWSVEQGGQPTSILSSDIIASSKLIGTYNDNLYFLSPERRSILRSIPEDDGYSEVSNWLRSFPDFEFEDATSMVVDGLVWVTTRQGQIFVFSGGQTEEFVISGLTEPFNSTLFLSTQAELEHIYLLEPAQQRLVMLRKDGTFIKQVKSDDLASATALVVNADETVAYVVSGSLIYSIGL